MGIDPGLATTGYGVISFSHRGAGKSHQKIDTPFKCLVYGTIKTSPLNSSPERLNKLYNELTKLTQQYRPAVMAVENIYFFKNLKTALPVSQAKGVILLAAAKKKIPVLEITPLQVKIALAGHGRAEKSQVQQVVKIILSLNEVPRPDDVADALAIAICCAGRMKEKTLPKVKFK